MFLLKDFKEHFFARMTTATFIIFCRRFKIHVSPRLHYTVEWFSLRKWQLLVFILYWIDIKFIRVCCQLFFFASHWFNLRLISILSDLHLLQIRIIHPLFQWAFSRRRCFHLNYKITNVFNLKLFHKLVSEQQSLK